MEKKKQFLSAGKNPGSARYLFPLLLSGLFFGVAATPVELLGCRNRGLIAVTIAMAAGLLGIAAAIKAIVDKARGRKGSHRLIITALLYALPACYIVLLAR